MLDIIAILDAVRSVHDNALIEVWRDDLGLRVSARVKIGDRPFGMTRTYSERELLSYPDDLNEREPNLFKRKLEAEIKKYG